MKAKGGKNYANSIIDKYAFFQWFMDELHQNCLEICYERKFSTPAEYLLNQKF